MRGLSVAIYLRTMNCSEAREEELVYAESSASHGCLLAYGDGRCAGAKLAQSRRKEFVFRCNPERHEIPIRIDQAIDVRVPSDGRVFTGTVAEDVSGQSSEVMIPRGARAELIVQNVSGEE